MLSALIIIAWALGAIVSMIIHLRVPTKVKEVHPFVYDNGPLTEKGALLFFLAMGWPVECIVQISLFVVKTISNLFVILGQMSRFRFPCLPCRGSGGEEGIGGRKAPCPECNGNGYLIARGRDAKKVATKLTSPRA